MKFNKRGVLDIQNRWPEYTFMVLFILGFIVAMFASNKYHVYIFITITGFITGGFLYRKKTRPPVPIYLLTYGYIFGFILALMITRKGDWKIALIFYILSNMTSYYLHERGFISG